MGLIAVDKEKCISCGACAAVCPRVIIRMDGQWPAEAGAESCIACGHCVAVCPTGALDNERAPLAGQLPLGSEPALDGPTVYRFLRSRRSVRRYKQAAVPREQVLALMDIARFAPTGSNSQGVSYLVYDDPGILRQITAHTIDWMEGQVKVGGAWAKAYGGYVRAYRDSGRDVILRDAPCFVVAKAPKDFPRGRENSIFSLAYVELYAPAVGLGTCWAGLFELCVGAGYAPLLELLALPPGLAVTGALMVGYPVFKYQRLADRKQLAIAFASPGK